MGRMEDAGWEVSCGHWQGWGKAGHRGREQGEPLEAVMKRRAGGVGGQLSSVCIWEVLSNFLCLFILLRRVPTKWPHPDLCAWGFAYFLCPLAPERLRGSSPHEEASLCRADPSSFP